MTIVQMRKMKSFIVLSLSVAATALGFFWLIFILMDVIINGISALGPGLFFNDPAPVGIAGGGLRNAIVGQFLIVSMATLIGVPIGLLGGTFIAEYCRGKSYARIISVLSDTMVSVPSIVVGTFIYALLVKPFGHFSGWAGAVALAVIMVPVGPAVEAVSRARSRRSVDWVLREAVPLVFGTRGSPQDGRTAYDPPHVASG